MAKIKSTLDLVMERTQNLNMTDEDRERIRRREAADKVRAWLTKYVDGKIDADEMKRDMEASAKKLPEIKNILKRELVARIGLEHDNDAILSALELVFDVGADPIKDLIASGRINLETDRQHCLDQVRSELKKDGIHGTAVVPNVKKTGQWQEIILAANDALAREINEITDAASSMH